MLWVTMGCSTMGYHGTWHHRSPWGKDQTPALHSGLASSWELETTQHSIAWMSDSATGVSISPRSPGTPSLSPGMDLAEPCHLTEA